MRFTLTGIALIIAGIFVKAHYTADAALCASPVGGLAQMFSSGAQSDCREVSLAVTLAPWAIGVGIAVVVVSALFILGVLGGAAATARRKRGTGVGQ